MLEIDWECLKEYNNVDKTLVNFFIWVSLVTLDFGPSRIAP